MSTKFNQCPNCGKRASSSPFFGSNTTAVYECKKCGTLYCYEHCGVRCPNCGSKDKDKVGYTISK